ncbi:EI24 domain-containing protein [Xinfangfangia sp. CPCC 101601]|uniref:EI24 domain-containing protein n=1 Tax=Pseudogemmobacter lacusdianii TaxID=3069608 RepID=A0ABU0VSV1_9RHOB|nr:EI24 domain-containing protein [Xinfangfangia sp. CPCC 101601]
MLGAFFKALGQMGDRRFLLVLLAGIAGAFALLFGVYALLVWGLQSLTPEAINLPWIGEIQSVHSILGWASLLVMLGLSIFLMVPVAGAFISLFTETVARAVEAKHYPMLPPAQGASFGASMIETVNLLGLLLLVNLLAFLILLPLTGPFYPVIFWAVNGLLLGREFFMSVAMRRLPKAEAAAMRKKNAARIWLAGTLMAVPLSVPVLNLLVPVLGVATFTHLFQSLRSAQNQI